MVPIQLISRINPLNKIKKIFMLLVGVKAQSRIETMQSHEPRLSQSEHKVKTRDPEVRSLGYETMTTLSEPVSVLL